MRCEKCLQEVSEVKICDMEFFGLERLVTKTGVKQVDRRHEYCLVCYELFHKHIGEAWL